MMDRAKKAMVPPFEISVFADPAGSFTTAAAMVACAKKALREKFSHRPQGDARAWCSAARAWSRFASAVIAASDGAKATLVGYDGPGAGQEARSRMPTHASRSTRLCRRHATRSRRRRWRSEADIIFAAGPAGARILTPAQLKQAKALKVAADVNAVPPSGIEGVGVNDNGKPIAGTNARRHRRARHRQREVQDRGRPVQRDDRGQEAGLSRFPGRLRSCPETRWLTARRCCSRRSRRGRWRNRRGAPASRRWSPISSPTPIRNRRLMPAASSWRHRARHRVGEPVPRARRARRAAGPSPILGFVYGAGFEDRPELLALHRRALAAARQRCRDGRTRSRPGDLLRRARPPRHCPSRDRQRAARQNRRAGWRSAIGGAGGSHIVPSRLAKRRRRCLLPGARRGPRRVGAVRRQWQRRRACSASASNGPRRPRAAPGAMAARFARPLVRGGGAAMAPAVMGSPAPVELKGLASADFLVRRRERAAARDQPAARRHARHFRLRRDAACSASMSTR